ncbi:MAG: hypothetical protein JWQ49_2751, partial [Edaphobacter sp.]|nr:hypothetical protein [Edaphobacter sp.]
RVGVERVVSKLGSIVIIGLASIEIECGLEG